MGLSFLERRFPILDRIIEGAPLILAQDGQPLEERMRKARVEPEDILVRARTSQAVERMDQIKYAVLETDGQISIIPKSS
ncbi:MAG: YetF domain-containing protein [Egibacteraceae bacterium]